MIEHESSSRLPVLAVGVALVALALAGSAHATGGSPVPVPDDPPPGVALTRVKVVQPVAASRATKEAAAAPTTQASVPSPDPPVVPTTSKQAEAARRAGAETVYSRTSQNPWRSRPQFWSAHPSLSDTARRCAVIGGPKVARTTMAKRTRAETLIETVFIATPMELLSSDAPLKAASKMPVALGFSLGPGKKPCPSRLLDEMRWQSVGCPA